VAALVVGNPALDLVFGRGESALPAVAVLDAAVVAKAALVGFNRL
jgi:hypothetical protein